MPVHRMLGDDINIVSLVKKGEHYTVMYADSDAADALRSVGKWAANPEMAFTWHDAAVLGKKIRDIAEKSKNLSDDT